MAPKGGFAAGRPFDIITTLGVLRFEPDSKEMVLVSVHPGVSIDMVIANTAWPLKVAKDLFQTLTPTDTELDILCRHDPQGFWTGE